jgi:T-complex protein 1 subunit theta
MSNLLKEGTRYLKGVTEATLKNLEAVKELSKITRTSLGPNGMNKMVINRHGKLFVTNDAATIIRELELVHPAAKMCVMTSEQQQSEIGDATNLVVIFCGELLAQADTLIRMGLHPADVIRGFEKSGEEALKILEELATEKISDFRSLDEVTKMLRSSISAKQYGFENVFTPIVSKACINVLPENEIRFNVDNIRVAKILGGGYTDATLVKGVVVLREPEGTITSVEKAKVAVFTMGIDTLKTDAQGKVWIEDSKDLESYAKSEEDMMEAKIKTLADANVKLVISGGTVGDMAMHFLERYNIMVIKCASKFELRRICVATGAKALITVGSVAPEELGFVDKCYVHELGSTMVTVIEQETRSKISTIVVRAATQNILDDIERAIDDSINIFKQSVRDPRYLPGAGATEIELARRIQSIGESTPGEDQYAIKKYAEAFEVVPRTLAENAGLDPIHTISQLYAKHESGNAFIGVDASGKNSDIDATKEGIFDNFRAKYNAIRLATNCAVEILRVGQIIMAKQAGVPVPGGPTGSGTMGSYDSDAAF